MITLRTVALVVVCWRYSSAVQPFERRGFRRVPVAQPAEEHHRERPVERPVLIAPEQGSLLLRLVLVQQAVGELVRSQADHPGSHQALGQPPQVFHQHQPAGWGWQSRRLL